ncbi:MAG TPA: hypothetical protein VJV78_29730 [Polyangiales bacterium]|nr:hypothetical protein [Polyangiales bacterium]
MAWAKCRRFIRAPVGFRGNLFQNTCDDAYAYIASEGYAPQTPSLKRFLTERNLSLQPFAGCAPYTEPPFERRFEQAPLSGCAY